MMHYTHRKRCNDDRTKSFYSQETSFLSGSMVVIRNNPFFVLWNGMVFLIETLRRITTYIPPIRRKLMGLLLTSNYENHISSIQPQVTLLSKVLGVIILIAWIGFTIIVFAKFNVSAFTIFTD